MKDSTTVAVNDITVHGMGGLHPAVQCCIVLAVAAVIIVGLLSIFTSYFDKND